mmetsp:Transcript_48145/g.54497  ORF Transcript_48145/g.54497 Transcript_48145/m.54497 type:complete len:107 (-) Transcript_48145:58-378(-)
MKRHAVVVARALKCCIPEHNGLMSYSPWDIPIVKLWNVPRHVIPSVHNGYKRESRYNCRPSGSIYYVGKQDGTSYCCERRRRRRIETDSTNKNSVLQMISTLDVIT